MALPASKTPFFDILTKGLRTGQLPNHTKAAKEWYRNAGMDIQKVNRSDILKNQSSARKKVTPSTIEVGSMFLYNYDPKHKKTLDVYDTFPLVIPISVENDRFLGMNFHYLPPKLRAKLLDALYSVANNDKFDRSTKLNISYNILKQVAKSDLYKPTIHMYLKKHVKSKIRYIEPSEWNTVLMLPLAKFSGKNASMYSFGSK